MKINISHYVASTRVLGPYRRGAVWVQGCPFDCDGCLSPEMRGPAGNLLDCEELAGILIQFGGEGVTVSGGEPFAQAGAVARVINLVRDRVDYGVIVYSGCTIEELSERAKGDADTAALLGETDILIDGRYVKELDDGRPYRGSANQRILSLTGRYSSVLNSYYNNPCGRRTEINIGLDGVTLTGVPSAKTLAAWRMMKGSVGAMPRQRGCAKAGCQDGIFREG